MYYGVLSRYLVLSCIVLSFSLFGMSSKEKAMVTFEALLKKHSLLAQDVSPDQVEHSIKNVHEWMTTSNRPSSSRMRQGSFSLPVSRAETPLPGAVVEEQRSESHLKGVASDDQLIRVLQEHVFVLENYVVSDSTGMDSLSQRGEAVPYLREQVGTLESKVKEQIEKNEALAKENEFLKKQLEALKEQQLSMVVEESIHSEVFKQKVRKKDAVPKKTLWKRYFGCCARSSCAPEGEMYDNSPEWSSSNSSPVKTFSEYSGSCSEA